jgi:hypothetical protein
MSRCLLGHNIKANPSSPAVWKLGILNYQLREKHDLWKNNSKDNHTTRNPVNVAKEALKGILIF